MAFDRESSSVSLSNLAWSASRTCSPGSHPPALAWQKERCWANRAGAGQDGNLANVFSGELFHAKKLHFSFIYVVKATAQIWEYLGARGPLGLENKTRNIAVFRNLISVWMTCVYSSPSMSTLFYFCQSITFNVDNYFTSYAIWKLREIFVVHVIFSNVNIYHL